MKSKIIDLALLVCMTLAGSFLFASLAPRLAAQGIGGTVEAAYFRVLNTSGAGGWRVKVDSGNDLTFQNLDTAHALVPLNDVTIDQASGGIRFPGYTAAQMVTLAAPASGYIVWNMATDGTHTSGRLYISSGTGAGAWTVY